MSLLKRVPVGKLALEIFLIVVAVLLALAVDRWREARAEARIVRAVLQTVRAELERNLQILDARLAYHGAVVEAIEEAGDKFFVEDQGMYRLRSAERIPRREDIGIREDNGLGLAPDLSDTAWQAALASGALTSLDYRLFYHLAVVYTAVGSVRHQEEIVSTDLDGFDRAYLERQAPLTGFTAFQGSFQDLVLGERELRAETERALSLLRQPERADRAAAEAAAGRHLASAQ